MGIQPAGPFWGAVEVPFEAVINQPRVWGFLRLLAAFAGSVITIGLATTKVGIPFAVLTGAWSVDRAQTGLRELWTNEFKETLGSTLLKDAFGEGFLGSAASFVYEVGPLPLSGIGPVRAAFQRGAAAIRGATSSWSQSVRSMLRLAPRAKGTSFKNVGIVDDSGKLGEFDEVFENLIVENKSALVSNFEQGARFTGKPLGEIIDDWARIHIFDKTKVRIGNLRRATATIAEEGGARLVPSIETIKNIKRIHFRVQGNHPLLRKHVGDQVARLRKLFPLQFLDRV